MLQYLVQENELPIIYYKSAFFRLIILILKEKRLKLQKQTKVMFFMITSVAHIHFGFHRHVGFGHHGEILCNS